MLPTKSEMIAALELREGADVVCKLQKATVAICGLGGLGSNIAISLARSGVGTLKLIDFDNVDISNLHRQQYKASQIGMPKTKALLENLKEISPYTNYETYQIKVTTENAKSLLEGSNVICEAFDSAYAKAMLANFVLEQMPKSFLVTASGLAGIGSGNVICTRKISSNFYICGDNVSEVKTSKCLFAPRVMLCAAHQALVTVRLLLGLSGC